AKTPRWWRAAKSVRGDPAAARPPLRQPAWGDRGSARRAAARTPAAGSAAPSEYAWSETESEAEQEAALPHVVFEVVLLVVGVQHTVGEIDGVGILPTVGRTRF